MTESLSMQCGQCALALTAYHVVFTSITHRRKGDIEQNICIFFYQEGWRHSSGCNTVVCIYYHYAIHLQRWPEDSSFVPFYDSFSCTTAFPNRFSVFCPIIPAPMTANAKWISWWCWPCSLECRKKKYGCTTLKGY